MRTERATGALWLVYEVLLVVAYLCYLPRAVLRRRLPHRGWSMRLGRYPSSVTQRLDARRTIWIHAVSVGEALAARPLVEALASQRPTQPIVLSTITSSGLLVAGKQVAPYGVAIYCPLDLRGCVRRALDAIRPSILILMESELWPVLIEEMKARGIPVVVVNGRISARAFRRYHVVRPWLVKTVGQVDLWLMQSEADADRARQLGAPTDRVRVVGSLKWDASVGARPTPEAIEETMRRISLNRHDRVIVAGSTHRGEEELLLRAFDALHRSDTALRLILAPRHLERLAEVERLIQQFNVTPVRLSQASSVQAWRVGLVDTFGELPRYYGLATVAFIGGSLIPHGGQNPLEAASLGKPVIFGPHMHNFAEIAQELAAHQAAVQLTEGSALYAALERLLRGPDVAKAMGRRAQELTERSKGALQCTLATLTPFLALPPT